MTEWWNDKPWRMIQMNLREIDMIDIDARRIVADLQDFRANCFMINAAGIIASYPTDLPFQFQSPFLQGDSLATIIDACHAAGIRVFARTDFSKVRRPIYEMHPEWAYRTPTGEIVDYNGDIAVCINGDYQQEYALRIVEDLLTRLPFDGIFFNMGGFQTRDYHKRFHGICHCDNCQRKFAASYGLPLPKAEDLDDPTYRKYAAFKEQVIRDHHEKVYRFIQDLRPDLSIANHREFRRGFIRQESNTAIDRPLPHWQYSGSDNTKWAVSSYPGMISSNTTVDFIDFPYRHVAVSPHQQKLRLAQNLANGGALDYYLIGRIDNHEDRTGFQPVKELFHYHATHEALYSRITSRANVALINGPHANQAEFRGWFRFLVENHFLFDTLMTDTVLELPLDKYQAIVLPDFQAIGDDLARRLDRFVGEGGLLIASGESGFRDESDEPRTRPALQSLGIRRVQQIRQHMTSSYFKVLNKSRFPRLVDVDLIYMDGPYVYADYAEAAEPFLGLIPPHAYGPPERCYYTQETAHPGYVVHSFGAGKAIYLPWRPGALFHRQGYPNTTWFIADLLEEVAGVARVGGNLSPMVEVTHFESTDRGYGLVHLVNASGHFGTSFFEPVTMHALQVEIAYPEKPATVRSLVHDAEYDHEWRQNRLTIHVPRLELFDAIQIQ
jgi:hypothetical protein